jgi:hypothetical protein
LRQISPQMEQLVSFRFMTDFGKTAGETTHYSCGEHDDLSLSTPWPKPYESSSNIGSGSPVVYLFEVLDLAIVNSSYAYCRESIEPGEDQY